MQQRVTSSWRRKSDASPNSDDKRQGEGARLGNDSAEMPRILIVDSDLRAADSLEQMLNAAGYTETRVAYSAHAALIFAVDFQPDVAFLEMDLLDMDSNDLAERLRDRAQSHDHDLRLIAMTGNRQHDGSNVARNAGFERCLLKPIAPADLSNLLDAHATIGYPPIYR